MSEANKVVARKIVEEVFNQGKQEMIDQYFAPEYVEHDELPGVPPTREGIKMLAGAFRTAFPDLHYHIDAEIAEGDKVVQYMTAHATMKGEFQGMPATGKHGSWKEVHIGRIQGGKLIEHWSVVDQLGMLVSLGVMPPPVGGGA